MYAGVLKQVQDDIAENIPFSSYVKEHWLKESSKVYLKTPERGEAPTKTFSQNLLRSR
jgi:hypothetical protein